MRLFTTRRVWTGLAVKQARAEQAKAADQAAMADMEDLFGSEAESEAERKGAADGRAGELRGWAHGASGCFSAGGAAPGDAKSPSSCPAPPACPAVPASPGETAAESVPGGSGTGLDSWGSRREDVWPAPLRAYMAN